MIFTSYENILKERNILLDRLNFINDFDILYNKEKFLLKKYLDKANQNILKIEEDLKDLSGIEYSLYYQIVIKGTNITKAIDKVAFEYDKDVSTLWKNYYPKIKERINLIKKI